MFELIDWDKVFNWQIWQIVKWVYGVIVTIALVFLIYQNNTYKTKINALTAEKNDIVSTAIRVLHDNHSTDQTMLQKLIAYMEEKL